MPMNRGFTLIEVLVTLVILTFGLLGIAGLMAKGQRASFEAFERQQALGEIIRVAFADKVARVLAQDVADFRVGIPTERAPHGFVHVVVAALGVG